MKLSEAKQQFICSWGAWDCQWSINTTMAQIHALLLVSPFPITQDDLMKQHRISRGNINMNIPDLNGGGLPYKRNNRNGNSKIWQPS